MSDVNISVRARQARPKAAAQIAAGANGQKARRIPGLNATLGVLPGLLGYILRRTHESVFNDFLKNVTAKLSSGKASGLTPGQFGVIAIIAANPGLKQIALGGALGVDRSTIVAAVDKLEQRGLVERRPVPHDRRAHALNLTAEGQRVYKKALALIERHEARIVSSLSPQERAQLLALLNKVMKATEA